MCSRCYAYVCVTLPWGSLVGMKRPDKTMTFLGIPYAHPPVGELRFRLPETPYTWTNQRYAFKVRDACMQLEGFVIPHIDFLLPGQKKSEDCLYLDIYVDGDQIKPNSKMPVVVFIHGGSFTSGTSAIYNCTFLVKGRGIIAVTLQYRLGIFGFLQSPLEDEIPGNLGLQDQLAAMKWVKQFISNFGGDPNQVTLMGQSAGAMSVSFHLVSPLSQNLFDQAILESGSIYSFPLGTKENAYKYIIKMLRDTGCDKGPDYPYDCLRSLDAERVMTFFKEHDSDFGPTVDKRFFVNRTQVDLFEKENATLKSIILGHNGNEGALFLSAKLEMVFPATSISFDAPIFKYFMEAAERLVPPSFRQTFGKVIDITYGTSSVLYRTELANRLGTIIGDLVFGCPNYYFVNTLLKRNPSMKAYYYYFLARPNWVKVPSTYFWEYIEKAIHSEELQFVFGGPFINSSRFDEEEVRLSLKIIDYWTYFIKNGRMKDSFQWPAISYNGTTVNYNYMLFQNSSYVEPMTGYPPNYCNQLPRFVHGTQLRSFLKSKTWKRVLAGFS